MDKRHSILLQCNTTHQSPIQTNKAYGDIVDSRYFTEKFMNRLFTLITSIIFSTVIVMTSITTQASDVPNLLVMGEDENQDAIPRNSQVFKRVINTLTNQMHDNGFDVYDETAITLDNFEQGRVKRSNAEIIDIARSIKRPPIDIAVLFSIYASANHKEHSSRIKTRIEGRLLNVKTGKSLGNFDVNNGQYLNAPKQCRRECLLEVVGDNAHSLANDLGAILAEKLLWMTEGANEIDSESNTAENGIASKSHMLSEYSLVFDGFSAEDFSDIEEFLVIFSGYHSLRPIEIRHTRSEVWYKSTISTAKLSRNLQKMLKELRMRGMVNFEGNTFTVKKITLRGQHQNRIVSSEW
jgi:hypothetical protein